MADFPAPQSASGSSTGPVSAALLAYVLFGIAAVVGLFAHGLPIFAPLVGILGIIALIVCYVKRSDAAGTWVASHFSWLIGMFWWSLLWSILAGIVLLFSAALAFLIIPLIGFPIAWGMFLAIDIWVIYRLVKGYLNFKDSRPVGPAV